MKKIYCSVFQIKWNVGIDQLIVIENYVGT